MARILFVARESSNVSTGASVITERNLELLRNLHGHLNVNSYWLSQQSSRKSQFVNALKMNLSGLSQAKTKGLLLELSSGNYNEVFLDNSLLGKLSRIIKIEFPHIKVNLFFHNVEYDYFHRLLFSSKKFWHLLSIKAAKHNEQLGCDYSDELWFLNNRDATRIFELYHVTEGKSYRLLPTSMNDRFSKEQCVKNETNDKLSILFVGTLFFSNFHGIQWFANNVLPFIDAELLIVGRDFETVADKFSDTKIRVIGTVENLDPYYYNTDLFIAPIFKGSGMKTKLTEAMMFGKQILGTREAFEGYDTDLSSIGYLCNTADDFIDVIIRNKFKKFDVKSRECFLKNYDSKVSIHKIQQAPLIYAKEKKMVFAELARTGLIHNNINASLVEVFRTSFQVKRVDFWGESSHVNKLNLFDVNFFSFSIYCVDISVGWLKKIKLLIRELGFVLAWLRILFYVRRKRVNIIVVTSILPIVHLVMKYTLRYLPQKTKVYLVLHGEVENINEHRNTYYNFLEQAIKSDSKIGNRFKYVVLANFIKSNLLSIFSLKDSDVITIPHPYEFNNAFELTSKKSNKPIVFGSIGVHTKLVKQSHLIFELAHRFKPQIENGTIEFRIIGALDESVKAFVNESVIVINSNGGMLSKIEFEKEVSKLDFVLFFAPDGSYRFTASGSVLDALKYRIPIIGLKNEFLKELNENVGQIGYLLEDIEEMEKTIGQLINNFDYIFYKEIQGNMVRAQSFFSIQNAIKGLKFQV